MGFTEIRRFHVGDLNQFTALYNASEDENPDFRTCTAAEMMSEIIGSSEYDPEGHFVAVEGNTIVGSARGTFNPQVVKVRGPVGYLELHVLHDFWGTAAERELTKRVVEYMRMHGIESVQTRVDTRYEAKVKMLERLGFTKTTYQNHGLERDPIGIGGPPAIDGYEFRLARIPEELGTMLRVFNEAFATRDRYVPMAMDRLAKHHAVKNPDNHSGAFLVARKGNGEVVGMVLSSIGKKYNEEHAVRRGGTFGLAVVPSERKKGLGTALLMRSIQWIGDRGMDKAWISVNVANIDALDIYRRAGYKTIQVYQGYELKLK